MPWVSQILESQATGQLKSVYAELQPLGGASEFFRVQGSTPEVISAQLKLVLTTLRDGALTRFEKEQIIVVVSGLNTSSYCVARHLDVLQSFGMEAKLARKLAVDYANAPVPAKMQPLLQFADKLTRKPDQLSEADANAILAAGWSEDALREAVQTIALGNYINRISIGFGLMTDW